MSSKKDHYLIEQTYVKCLSVDSAIKSIAIPPCDMDHGVWAAEQVCRSELVV